jgi:hypothetical protein
VSYSPHDLIYSSFSNNLIPCWHEEYQSIHSIKQEVKSIFCFAKTFYLSLLFRFEYSIVLKFGSVIFVFSPVPKPCTE